VTKRDGRADHSFWFEPGLPRLLAHRGLAIDAPENTLLAFVKALALGATYLETDVRSTRDGVAIICHDPDLIRVAKRNVKVSDLTLKELRAIDLGEGQTFCTLAEVLEAFPDVRLNIDVKSLDAARPAAAAILKAGATKRVLITSFNEKRRRETVRLLPGVASSAAPHSILLAVIGVHLRFAALVRFAVRNVDVIQAPIRGAGIRIASRRFIAKMHALGLEVHIFTINDAPTMKRLLDLGVDGLFTDRVDVAITLTGTAS
jgi:glycerophosphoryl diester phosphodiesterase